MFRKKTRYIWKMAMLAYTAVPILEGYMNEVAKLDPEGNASDNMKAAYDWLVSFQYLRNARLEEQHRLPPQQPWQEVW